MEQIAKRVTDFYCLKQSIDPDVKVIYQIGFDVLFSTILQVTAILLAGLVLHHVQEAVLFLAGFYLLRQYGGGYHAESRGRCLGMMVALYIWSVCGVIVWTEIGTNLQLYSLAGMLIISVSLYLRYAPLPNPAKIFIPEHTRRNRKKAVMTIWIWLFGIGAAILCEAAQVWRIMTITLFVVAMLMLLKKIKG